MTELISVSLPEVAGIMECPVCKEVSFKPIFQCVTGHSVCKNCRPMMITCPLCKEKLTEKRNYALEEIVATSFHACCYKKSGCQVVERGDAIEAHMVTCEFKPRRKCPYYKQDECKNSHLEYFEVKQHLINVHGRVPRYEPSGKYSCSWTFHANHDTEFLMYGRFLLEFDGNCFILQRVSDETKITWALLFIGSPEDAKKYELELILAPKDGGKITWSNIPIHSINNRTVQSFLREEVETFKPVILWNTLRRLCSAHKENQTEQQEYEVTTTFCVTKK